MTERKHLLSKVLEKNSVVQWKSLWKKKRTIHLYLVECIYKESTTKDLRIYINQRTQITSISQGEPSSLINKDILVKLEKQSFIISFDAD